MGMASGSIHNNIYYASGDVTLTSVVPWEYDTLVVGNGNIYITENFIPPKAFALIAFRKDQSDLSK
jgi:hypothetical protein